MLAIDTPWNSKKHVSAMKSAGVVTVLRYYTIRVSTRLPEKRLGLDEAQALVRAGFQLGVVYEFDGNHAGAFSKSAGLADGEYSRHYASKIIGQPAGSAIYFGVDFDASDDEIKNRILPYFEGIAEAMGESSDDTAYDIGVYGSWKSCERTVKAGLTKYAWLAQSTAWGGRDGYRKFAAARKWNLKQGFAAGEIHGLDYDPNEINDDLGSIGQFVIPVSAQGPASADRFVVSARPNLRLRSGPGLTFDVIGSVPFGTTISVMRRDGDWAFVDINGDGGIDGVVHAGFLTPA